MPRFEDHCRQALATFGRDWFEVHRWLDEYAGSTEYGFRHRRVRHHEAGIRELAERLGPEAADAARQHIIADLREEGWTEQNHFPRDAADYNRMGLF